MIALRCPKCGTLTYEGHFAFPKCHVCHEDLTKCCYCENYPGDGRVCYVSPEKPVVRGDDVRQCGSYRSKLQVAVFPSQFSSRSNIAACIITSAVMGIIVAVLSMLPQPSHRANSSIAVKCQRDVRRGEDLIATLTIPRSLRASSANIRILIPKETLAFFSLLNVSPMPTSSAEDERHIICSYDGARLTSDSLTVSLTLRPLKDGRYNLRFEVVEEDMHGNLARKEVLTWSVNVIGEPSEKKPLRQSLFIIAFAGVSLCPTQALNAKVVSKL